MIQAPFDPIHRKISLVKENGPSLCVMRGGTFFFICSRAWVGEAWVETIKTLVTMFKQATDLKKTYSKIKAQRLIADGLLEKVCL